MTLFIIFRALGIESDKEILQYIVHDIENPNMERYMNILRSSIKDSQGVKTQKEAFLYLQEKLPQIKNKSDKFKLIYVLDILQNHFIPHIVGSLSMKAHYLGYMVREILDVYLGINQETDKDSYIFLVFLQKH